MTQIKLYTSIDHKEFYQYRASLISKGFKIHHYTIEPSPNENDQRSVIVFHVTPPLATRIGDAYYAFKATLLDYIKRQILRPTARLLDRNRIR